MTETEPLDLEDAVVLRETEFERLRVALGGWEPPGKCLACGADPMNRDQCFVCGADQWEVFALRERALVEQLVKAIRIGDLGVTPPVGRALAAYDKAREAEEVKGNGEAE